MDEDLCRTCRKFKYCGHLCRPRKEQMQKQLNEMLKGIAKDTLEKDGQNK